MFQNSDVYEQAYENALKINQQYIDDWTEHKANLEDLRNHLKFYPKKLSHKVLVPLGKNALMPGKLVRTNEIFIKLGANIVLKRSAVGATEVCDRIIKRCDKQIGDYKKEQELLSSNMTSALNKELFGSNDEIIEPYDEESEKQWRINHREKVKQYKLEENLKRTDVMSNKDAMAHLEELEFAESLNSGDSDSSYESDISTSSSSQDFDSEDDSSMENVPVQRKDLFTSLQDTLTNIQSFLPKREEQAVNLDVTKRVSFSDELVTENAKTACEVDDSIPIIYFEHHADVAVNTKNDQSVDKTVGNCELKADNKINSPSDICNVFQKKSENKTLKSILKTTAPCTENFAQANGIGKEVFSEVSKVSSTEVGPDTECAEITAVADDIVARKSSDLPVIQDSKNRPISQFKASRKRNK